jgi:metal-responsive CopG/Arc/MetJ family transcriptional regulator
MRSEGVSEIYEGIVKRKDWKVERTKGRSASIEKIAATEVKVLNFFHQTLRTQLKVQSLINAYVINGNWKSHHANDKTP